MQDEPLDVEFEVHRLEEPPFRRGSHRKRRVPLLAKILFIIAILLLGFVGVMVGVEVVGPYVVDFFDNTRALYNLPGQLERVRTQHTAEHRRLESMISDLQRQLAARVPVLQAPPARQERVDEPPPPEKQPRKQLIQPPEGPRIGGPRQ